MARGRWSYTAKIMSHRLLVIRNGKLSVVSRINVLQKPGVNCNACSCSFALAVTSDCRRWDCGLNLTVNETLEGLASKLILWDGLINILVQRQIISDQHRAHIETAANGSDKKMRLLKIMAKRSTVDFNGFTYILKNNDDTNNEDFLQSVLSVQGNIFIQMVPSIFIWIHKC